MQNNAVTRIGVSVQGVGMAWCKCYKKDGIYYIEEFEETKTSFSKLAEILTKKVPIYSNQKEIIKPHVKNIGLSFKEIQTTREEVEPKIASFINEGKVFRKESAVTLLNRVIEQDYLIQERQTPAAQALHFGLGELIYQSSKPLGCSVFIGAPLKLIDLGDDNQFLKAEIRRRNSRFEI